MDLGAFYLQDYIEVEDWYAGENGKIWRICSFRDDSSTKISIPSTLNSLFIREVYKDHREERPIIKPERRKQQVALVALNSTENETNNDSPNDSAETEQEDQQLDRFPLVVMSLLKDSTTSFPNESLTEEDDLEALLDSRSNSNAIRIIEEVESPRPSSIFNFKITYELLPGRKFHFCFQDNV